jgi:DnaJ-class molecular chaperone
MSIRKSSWHDPRRKTCPTCNGSGADSGADPTGRTWQDKSGREHVHNCPDCGGFGNAR